MPKGVIRDQPVRGVYAEGRLPMSATPNDAGPRLLKWGFESVDAFDSRRACPRAGGKFARLARRTALARSRTAIFARIESRPESRD